MSESWWKVTVPIAALAFVSGALLQQLRINRHLSQERSQSIARLKEDIDGHRHHLPLISEEKVEKDADLPIQDPPLLRYERFGKNELLLGAAHCKRLAEARILVMGTGGVGSWVVESLARAGVGALILVDPGVVKLSNCSQQIPALSSTIGQHKVTVLAARVKEINPECIVIPVPLPANEANASELLRSHGRTCSEMSTSQPLFDIVIDCADRIVDKAAMLAAAHKVNIPSIISVLGAATRLEPNKINVADLKKTSHCPVGKRLRKLLNVDYDIKTGITCVYSTEPPRNVYMTGRDSLVDKGILLNSKEKKQNGGEYVQWTPSPMGSWVVLPAMFALYAAHHAIMSLAPAEAPSKGFAELRARTLASRQDKESS